MNPLLLPILLPAAFGVLALFVPGRRHATSATLGVLGAIGLLAAALAVFDVRDALVLPWLTLGPIDAAFALRGDGFSSWAVVFAVGPVLQLERGPVVHDVHERVGVQPRDAVA